jgi:ribosomal protein S8
VKDISISAVLDSMNGDTAYMTDMWENCVDEKRKRYTRSKFSDALDILEDLGYLKKYGYKTESSYTKLKFIDTADQIGFINNVIFTNESKINKALVKLNSRKIFIVISKDLNTHKLNKHAIKDYELFLDGTKNMLGLSSSILFTIKNSSDFELKKELKSCLKQIKNYLDETNETLMKFRGSNERIVLQRIINNKTPEPGFLKI